ncbi:MAG: amino acid permease, partial [Deltaproteobacteria bacterium]|nr:amino acid permease [Deltaproteobacteria bacterium]
LVGGLLALAGALTLAELGASMPKAGGLYVYIREAYGPLAGFLFGWVLFIVYQTAAIAALGVAFAEYLGHFFPALSTKSMLFSTTFTLFNFDIPLSVSIGQLVGIMLIISLSTVNYFGVVYGKLIQNIFTIIKISTLVLIIFFGLTIGSKTSVDFNINPTGLSFGQLITGFGLALIAASWAYNGWNYFTFVAEEVKDPNRNIPRSLLFATGSLIILYLLTNYIYLLALPINEMSGVIPIAKKASVVLFGRTAASLISVAVIISTFGAMNGTILSGARVFYAMAKDKLFFKKAGEVHPRFLTPGFAIIIQGIWACLYTLMGSLEQLFTFAMFVTLMFWIVATASVFTLRKKYPDLPRPYKTWGYPVVPLVFILASSGILLNTLFEKPVESLAGVGLTILGIPVYYFWKRKK